MTTVTETASAATHTYGPLGTFLGLVKSALGRINRYREFARAEEHLKRLSDHELADIGLCRGEIHRRVWSDF